MTRETPAEVVRRSLAERLRDEQVRRGRQPIDRAEVQALIKRFNALPLSDARTEDEVLGYDENGLPS